MTHVSVFRKRHMDKFRPGDADREAHRGTPPRRLANMIHEDAAITILDGPRVLGFAGVHVYAGSVVLWSMWSAEARAKPLAMCRTLKRLLVAWRQEYARELVALDLGQAPQAKLARWLGMRERAPGEWVI